MVQLRLRYLVEDVDRHGNVRLYVRRRGQAKIRIRAPFGSPEFLAAYEAALRGIPADAPEPLRRLKTGSFVALCQAYYASAEFKRLDASTRNWRQRALNRLCQVEGEKPAARMEARHIRRLRDDLAQQPGAANSRLKALKALFAWAVEAGEAAAGHHSWTVSEVAQFEDRHPIGTKARLALALLLYTAGRREDAVRLGPRHVSGGRVRFTKLKMKTASLSKLTFRSIRSLRER